MIVVGLTGGFGCGKSTVADELDTHRFITTVDCDDLAKQIMTGRFFRPTIISLFSSSVILPNDSLDLKAIAKIIFQDESIKHQLEAELHPLVWTEVGRYRVQAEEDGKILFVIESAILFEIGGERHCDLTVCVTCSEKVQRERLKKNRGFTDEEIDARLANQMPLKEKKKKADLIFYNNIDRWMLHKMVDHLCINIIHVGWHINHTLP